MCTPNFRELQFFLSLLQTKLMSFKTPIICVSGTVGSGPYILTDSKRENYLTIGTSQVVPPSLPQEWSKFYAVQWTQVLRPLYQVSTNWMMQDGILLAQQLDSLGRVKEKYSLIIYEDQVFAIQESNQNIFTSQLFCDGRIQVNEQFVDQVLKIGTPYQFFAWDWTTEKSMSVCISNPQDPTCAAFVRSYCSQNYNTYPCQNFCKTLAEGGNFDCDQVADEYCAVPEHTQENNCGCFLTEQYYKNYFDDLQKEIGVPYPGIRECFYTPCASGKHRNHTLWNGTCPPMTLCVQNITFNNNGHIETIIVDQSQDCGQAPDFKYTCTDGKCVEVEEGRGAFNTSNCDGVCADALQYSCIDGKCQSVAEGTGDYDNSLCDDKCGKFPVWGYLLIAIGIVALLSLLFGMLYRRKKVKI